MPWKTSVKTTTLETPKAIFFDLDNTFLLTKEIFEDKMSQVYRYLADLYPGVKTADEIRDTFEPISDSAFETHGVDPSGWRYVLPEFQSKMPHISADAISHAEELLMEIYKTVPEVYDGTHEVLQYFKKDKKPTFLVTHANEDWTWWKLDVTELSKYFGKHNVHVVDALKHKDAMAWKEGIVRFGYEPQEVVVIGDSLRSDIGPALEIKADAIHVVRPSPWMVQHKELEGDFKKVESLLDIPKLFENRKSN